MSTKGLSSPTNTKNTIRKLSPKKILRKLRAKDLSERELQKELSNLNISKLEAISVYLGFEKGVAKKETVDVIAVRHFCCSYPELLC